MRWSFFHTPNPHFSVEGSVLTHTWSRSHTPPDLQPQNHNQPRWESGRVLISRLSEVCCNSATRTNQKSSLRTVEAPWPIRIQDSWTEHNICTIITSCTARRSVFQSPSPSPRSHAESSSLSPAEAPPPAASASPSAPPPPAWVSAAPPTAPWPSVPPEVGTRCVRVGSGWNSVKHPRAFQTGYKQTLIWHLGQKES